MNACTRTRHPASMGSRGASMARSWTPACATFRTAFTAEATIRSPCGACTSRKGDGRTRPLGIPALEDKIVQQAALMLLEPIYEQEFLGFSYGFRPGRSPHRALDVDAARSASRGHRSRGACSSHRCAAMTRDGDPGGPVWRPFRVARSRENLA